jgi:hypothetical protein
VARRKRLGRRPAGRFSGLTAVTTWRMPADMRAQLESARKARSKKLGRKISLSQEMLNRLQGSFNRERDVERDRVTRAFYFLFSTAQRQMGIGESDWHRDPKLFRATKLAIGKLLDHFEQAENLKLSARETQSAKTMADTAVQTVLGIFYDVSPLVPAFTKVWTEMEDMIPDPSGKRAFKEWRDTQYGMEQVRQVLRTEHKS